MVYDTNKLEVAHEISCHRTIILKIAVNYSGNLVATCSTHGTMIRVFSLPTGIKLYAFRRNNDSPNRSINNQQFLNFSKNN